MEEPWLDKRQGETTLEMAEGIEEDYGLCGSRNGERAVLPACEVRSHLPILLFVPSPQLYHDITSCGTWPTWLIAQKKRKGSRYIDTAKFSSKIDVMAQSGKNSDLPTEFLPRKKLMRINISDW